MGHDTISKVEVSNTAMGQLTIDSLANLIGTSSSLKDIEIARSSFSDISLDVVSEAMIYGRIVNLTFDKCSFSKDKCLSLAEMIRTNKSLVHLGLQSSTFETPELVGEALVLNSTLPTISTFSSNLSLSLFNSNTSLTNGLFGDASNEGAELVSRNKTLVEERDIVAREVVRMSRLFLLWSLPRELHEALLSVYLNGHFDIDTLLILRIMCNRAAIGRLDLKLSDGGYGKPDVFDAKALIRSCHNLVGVIKREEEQASAPVGI